MSRFENKLCPVCRKRFGKDDEIVVCPDCGTPHHRVCWNSLNHCGVEEFHGMNYVWNGRLPDEDEPKISEPEVKPEHSDDPHHAQYPNVPVTPAERQLSAFSNEPEVEELVNMIQSNEKGEDGVSMRELAAFSATSLWHYAYVFQLFREGKKKRRVFFNLCSGLFAPIFQFYRRMDWFGVLIMIVMIAPAFTVAKLSGGADAQLADGVIYLLYLANIAVDVLLCLFGDYIYYRHVVKRILKIRAGFEGDTDSDEYFMTLYENGKPSLARAALAILGVVLIEECAKLVL